MGNLMLQSSVAAACKSWNPPLPTDTVLVLAPAPTLEQPSLEYVLPPSASSLCLQQGVVTPSSENEVVASPRPSGERPESSQLTPSLQDPRQPWGSWVCSSPSLQLFSPVFSWGHEGKRFSL